LKENGDKIIKNLENMGNKTDQLI
jgi:hypothetical protein